MIMEFGVWSFEFPEGEFLHKSPLAIFVYSLSLFPLCIRMQVFKYLRKQIPLKNACLQISCEILYISNLPLEKVHPIFVPHHTSLALYVFLMKYLRPISNPRSIFRKTD
jgi:hypothetical protein